MTPRVDAFLVAFDSRHLRREMQKLHVRKTWTFTPLLRVLDEGLRVLLTPLALRCLAECRTKSVTLFLKYVPNIALYTGASVVLLSHCSPDFPAGQEVFMGSHLVQISSVHYCGFYLGVSRKSDER